MALIWPWGLPNNTLNIFKLARKKKLKISLNDLIIIAPKKELNIGLGGRFRAALKKTIYRKKELLRGLHRAL